MFDGFFKKRKLKQIAYELYISAVGRARHIEFYTELGVPDTLEGRFDMISLHVFLVLRRLKGEGQPMQELGQAIFDAMFADMDRNFREMGFGDIGVGNRVKKLVQAFYGRVAAYDEGLNGEDSILISALRRNVYRSADVTDEQVLNLAGYLRSQATNIDKNDLEAFASGKAGFENYGMSSESLSND
jgi:cytochrome b pre-mRNA-processing protein 3